MAKPLRPRALDMAKPPRPRALDISAVDPVALGKVAVLMGGRSAEREVSLLSGRGVLRALCGRGVDAHSFDPAERPLDALKHEGFASAFIALHGRYGEDGTVQGALELLDIPYTGSGVLASALAIDKIFTKRIWQAHGLPTPPFEVLASADFLPGLVETVGLPLILKAPREGSTIGLVRVDTAEELACAFSEVACHDREVLAESFIDGAELTVPIVGSGADAAALPIVDIRAPGGNYDYHNKYFSDDTVYLCPAPLGEEATAAIQQLALAAYHALGCEGWGRVDLMLSGRDRKPWLLEVNTAPGMTGHSLVPIAARAVAVPYDELVLAIAASARLKVALSAPVRS